MTYNRSFERALRRVGDWVKADVKRRTIVYTGELESDEGEIRLVNYTHF